jgi:hypothetical protein
MGADAIFYFGGTEAFLTSRDAPAEADLILDRGVALQVG